MFSGFPSISAPTKRLIILTAASALLLAAGQVPQTDEIVSGPTISDEILAPVTAAEAAASAAALAATTPADIAAAARARNAVANIDDSVTFPAEDAAAPVRPAKLTTLVASMDDVHAAVAKDRELHCLANAVYFESRGEPLEGQLAVAQAIINRVESGRYAGSICGVINQPKQFSFDRSRTPAAGNDWKTAQAIAKIAVDGMWHDVAPKALSFHAVRVSPNWAGKTRVAQIGNHVFYR